MKKASTQSLLNDLAKSSQNGILLSPQWTTVLFKTAQNLKGTYYQMLH